MARPLRTLLAILLLGIEGCALLGLSSEGDQVCVATDAVGRPVTCPAAEGTYPGDGCACPAESEGGWRQGIFFGRVAAE